MVERPLKFPPRPWRRRPCVRAGVRFCGAAVRWLRPLGRVRGRLADFAGGFNQFEPDPRCRSAPRVV